MHACLIFIIENKWESYSGWKQNKWKNHNVNYICIVCIAWTPTCPTTSSCCCRPFYWFITPPYRLRIHYIYIEITFLVVTSHIKEPFLVILVATLHLVCVRINVTLVNYNKASLRLKIVIYIYLHTLSYSYRMLARIFGSSRINP